MDAIESATDEELLALSARQPEAFGVFYRRHENAMLVFFLRRTRSAETAADLTERSSRRRWVQLDGFPRHGRPRQRGSMGLGHETVFHGLTLLAYN
jgi:RNA polymerase sigma-70 factor (ECF subfamily)